MSEKCKSCGAEIEYTAGSQSLTCPYCDAVNEIKKPEDELPNAVDQIIPLAVTQDDLEKQVYGFMASGDYTPDDMLDAATFIKRECFYVPAYLFKIDYEAVWTASFGYDRKEPYTAYRTVTSGNHTRQEAYTAYRTVTDWRPSNGVDSGIFSVSTYAGKTLHSSELSPNDIVPYAIANGKVTSFNQSFIKGVEAESFAVPEERAFGSLEDEINANVDNNVKSHAQGDHQQDWHWKAKMSHSSNTLYVPICHAIFDYQGTDYHYWTDGVSGSTIRADKLPEDLDRKKLVNLGFVPAGVASIGLIISSYLWGFSWAGMTSVAAMAIYAATRRQSIVGYSKNIRESLLTQIHASATAMKQLSNEEQEKFSKAFQRTEKPYFAKTHNDKIVIPSLSVAAFAAALMPAYFFSPGFLAPNNDQQTEVSEKMVVEQPKPELAQAAPVDVPNVTQNTTVDQQDTEGEATPAGDKVVASQAVNQQESTPTPSSESSLGTVNSGSPVAELLKLSADAQWQSIDAMASDIRQKVVPVTQGDRKSGRSSNQEGVALLRQSNIPQAIEAFKRGLDANPADIEIKNNLAFAYILNDDLNNAEQLLVDVLTRSPERSSAWANLSELYARKGGQANTSQAALRLAVHFSQNKQRTKDYLITITQTHPVALYRDIASKVILEIDGIPGKQ
jgi:LSD1 subclass zinc finger protein